MKELEVSSAKRFTLDFKPSTKSLIYIKNRSRPKTEPCGTHPLRPCQPNH